MTDDYTDDEVREAFQQGAGILPPFYDKGYEYEIQKRGDAFDAWLREHDAALIESLADGVDLPGSTATGYYGSEQVAGYRDAERDIEAWLRERARQVLEGDKK